MLVGDVIQAIREAITDQPPTLPIPTFTAANVSDASSTLAAGTYAVVVTLRNQWGETLPGTEVTGIVIASGLGLQVTVAVPPGATFVRVYLTLPNVIGAGLETQFVDFPVSTNSYTSTQFTVAANPTNAGTPPARNTAYNPDLDGDSFSAGTLFTWLNDLIVLATSITGGLIDYSGVQTVTGQPMYVVAGKWISIPDVWYDGYPLAPDKAGNFFRRNAITASVLSQVTTTLLTDRMMLEVWPQPVRTGSSTTLSAAMSAGQTNAPVASLGGFLLTNGMLQVDSEMMMYNGQSSNTFQNLIRGMGGTLAVAHASGAPVKELNLFFHGWRQCQPSFVPGNSQSNILIPQEWKPFLPIYGLARVKLAEQDIQGYQTLKKDFTDSLSQWMKQNKVTTGPRQLGDVSNNLEVIPSLGGGWVVPALFSTSYVIESELKMWHHLFGGGAWSQFTFMCCAILEMALFVMWGKRIIRTDEKRLTLADQDQREYAGGNGWKNYAPSACVQFLKSSKNVLRKIGESVSVFGSVITEVFENFSTRASGENFIALRARKRTDCSEKKEKECRDLIRPGK